MCIRDRRSGAGTGIGDNWVGNHCMMAGGNQIRNTTLLEMLHAAEKSQSERLRSQRKLCFLESRFHQQPLTPVPPTLPKVQKECKENTAGEKCIPADDSHCFRTETIPLTLDEIEWLDGVAKRHGHASASGVIGRLVNWANAEPPEAKKQLFLVKVRGYPL